MYKLYKEIVLIENQILVIIKLYCHLPRYSCSAKNMAPKAAVTTMAKGLKAAINTGPCSLLTTPCT